MKVIINGVRYDTEKATLIGEADNIGGGISRTSIHFWEAELYVTPKSGRYFLAGRGGPMSRFARSEGNNSWSGGSGIHPMTREEAFAFAQEELPLETVEEHFADMVEDA